MGHSRVTLEEKLKGFSVQSKHAEVVRAKVAKQLEFEPFHTGKVVSKKIRCTRRTVFLFEDEILRPRIVDHVFHAVRSFPDPISVNEEDEIIHSITVKKTFLPCQQVDLEVILPELVKVTGSDDFRLDDHIQSCFNAGKECIDVCTGPIQLYIACKPMGQVQMGNAHGKLHLVMPAFVLELCFVNTTHKTRAALQNEIMHIHFIKRILSLQ